MLSHGIFIIAAAWGMDESVGQASHFTSLLSHAGPLFQEAKTLLEHPVPINVIVLVCHLYCTLPYIYKILSNMFKHVILDFF